MMTRQAVRGLAIALSCAGLVFYGYHGVNPEEQKLGQRFRVDLTLWADLHPAAASDHLGDTISYATSTSRYGRSSKAHPAACWSMWPGEWARRCWPNRGWRGCACVSSSWTRPSPMATGTAGVELVFDRPTT